MGNRANIALLVSHLDNDFSKEIIAGANRAATELDANLVIFPVRFIKGDREDEYCFQHNTLIRYANSRDFDLVIVEAGTIGTFVTDEEMNSILGDFTHTKVITIAKKVGNFPCMKFNTKGFEEEIEHLFTRHQYTRVGFVSGPLTNDDAVERFEAYKKVLRQFGQEPRPEWICEGDFSIRSESAVEQFFAAHAAELDAVVFANDRMALLSYDICAKMGLKIGSDIAIAGFDDIDDSMVCDPPLTTVHADSMALGYQAVRDGLLMVEGFRKDTHTVDTVFMDRNSCGFNYPVEAGYQDVLSCKNSDELVRFIYDKFVASRMGSSEQTDCLTAALSYVRMVTGILELPENEIFNREVYKEQFHRLLKNGVLQYLNIDELNRIVEYLTLWVRNNSVSEQRAADISCLMFSNCKQVVIYNFQQFYDSDVKQRTALRGMNHLTNELFLNGFEFLDRGGELIAKDLDRINVGDCYIYLHDEEISIRSYEEFRLPHTHRIRFGRNENGMLSLEPENESVNSAFLFSNKFISERRHTLLCGTLFVADEHFGIIAAEMKPENFYFFNLSVRPQFSFLVKLYSMQAKQKTMLSMLEQSLGDFKLENTRLARQSLSDALTGEKNLRGFTEAFEESRIKPENQGREAVVLFCDLNNLKQINDGYGHDEGNYAIKKIAEALRITLPEHAVIARIGGDELVCFAYVPFGREMEFRDGIARYLSRENMLNSKKYWIESSIGYYEFLMKPELICADVINEADILMYADKKTKRKKVQKQ